MNHSDNDVKANPQADARAARLAAALKSNLRRRKAQARARAGLVEADSTNDADTATLPVAGRNEE